MSKPWQKRPATPRQESLFAPAAKRRKSFTQADVLITMLRDARAQHRALELPAIMQAGIAQHGARFNEIRSQGFAVRNETDRQGGAVRSYYWLDYDPERDVAR